MNFRSLSRGKVHWYRALFKTAQIAQNVKQPIPRVWESLVGCAKGKEADVFIKVFLDAKKESGNEW